MLALSSCFNYHNWDKEPDRSVLFFDNVEYREFHLLVYQLQIFRIIHEEVYSENTDEISCNYYSRRMTSRNNNNAYAKIHFKVPYSVFSSRRHFSSDDPDINKDDVLFSFTTEELLYNLYETTSWELNVDIIDVLYSSNNENRNYEELSGNLEYKMSVVDTLGISHQVSGWVKYSTY